MQTQKLGPLLLMILPLCRQGHPRAKLLEKLDYEVLGGAAVAARLGSQGGQAVETDTGSRAEPRPSAGLEVAIAAAWGQHSAPSTRKYLLHPGRDFRLEPLSPRWQHPPSRGRMTAGVEIIERPKIGAGSHTGPCSASDTSLRNSSVILAMVLGRPGIPGLTLSPRARISAAAGYGMESRVLQPNPRPASSPHDQPPRHLAGATLISEAGAPGRQGSAKFPAREANGASGVEAPSTHL